MREYTAIHMPRGEVAPRGLVHRGAPVLWTPQRVTRPEAAAFARCPVAAGEVP